MHLCISNFFNIIIPSSYKYVNYFCYFYFINFKK
nr:MAG TPA: hypothetical protein [Caudoviricetes sp.]